jgi:hypothetical protein
VSDFVKTENGIKAGELNIIVGGEGKGNSIVDKINKLSDDAYYICGTFYFGVVIQGKPVLNAISTNAGEEIQERQQAAYEELMAAGFCHVDTERGQWGYRSTMLGQDACALIRKFDKGTDGVIQ